MENKNRTAGKYEIINSLCIGGQEIVIGENREAQAGEPKYMCSYCKDCLIYSLYYDMVKSNDFVEIVEVFGKRAAEQAEKVREEFSQEREQGISDTVITADDCLPISGVSLENKVIVINPDMLYREYRTSTHQVMLCTGGFGASPNARGSACYCTNLFSGDKVRYERQNVLGILKPDRIPEWAKRKLNELEKQKAVKERER